jgi:pSer/pThr/pTyr-binding forkhead associated (FHA) protein
MEIQQARIILISSNVTFQTKTLIVTPQVGVKIGRKVNSSTTPSADNGYFDAKVLSRIHAELTMDQDQVWIQDLKSSNGTFVNKERLSEEGILSPLKELRTGDLLEFGVDIKDDDGKNLYTKISCKVTVNLEAISKREKIKYNNVPRTHDTAELLAMINVLYF